ncbi:hypothetical protein JD844_020047 [Phrynosoma platyrhinos]|uniref:Phosphatidylethanolamine N-methyltransferase n=1 Tax=Phrynosoma platyrhinos TaxID=52577 RepID=A0ABQ7TRK6_PHRPL|nr:hypothetical protein JD844_020047 [Phrynosoma platyrhinos]
MTLFFDYVDLTDPSFVTAVICIAFNPLFWNLVSFNTFPFWSACSSTALANIATPLNKHQPSNQEKPRDLVLVVLEQNINGEH